MKRIMFFLMVLCVAMVCSAAVQKAAAKTPSAPAVTPTANSDDATLQRMADETGFSKSILKPLLAKIKIDEVLMACCVSSMTGNSINEIVRTYGNDFKKYYADYHVDANAQINIQSKYSSLSAKIMKQSAVTSAYAGVDQNKAAQLIQQLTGVSGYDVKYYGFKSGLPENDILQAAEFAQVSGNRFGDIIDVKKRGSWADVWQRYGVGPSIQTSVAAKVSADSAAVFPPAAAAKTKPASVTPDMTKCVELLHEQFGIDKGKVMKYLNDGETTADVLQAFVIASKTGNDVYSVFKIKNESNWAKVYSYYSIGANKLTEITGICSSIMTKITAVP